MSNADPETALAVEIPENYRPGDLLKHPLVVAMLTLWLVNDHVLKELFGNFWTGKLSDVASLAVFPLLPLALYEIGCTRLGWPMRHGRLVLMISMVLTGAVMVGINVSDGWAHAYRVGLGWCQWPFKAVWAFVSREPIPGVRTVYLTMDVTDVWTLPALYIPYWVDGRTQR